MAERVLFNLPDGRWLALGMDEFHAALKAGQAAMGHGDALPISQPDSEPLLTATDMAKAAALPKSCIYEQARTGAIPSVRVGKHVRFSRIEVLAALRSTAPQANGHG